MQSNAKPTTEVSPPRSPRTLVKSLSVDDLRAQSRKRGKPDPLNQPSDRTLTSTKGDSLVPNIPSPRVDLEPPKEKEAESRILLASNRMPLTIKRGDDGKLVTKQSDGGLASGLAGVTKTKTCLWFGWLGTDIPPEERAEISKRCWDDQKAIPIYLPEALAEAHYNGFSNSILWPLFHYHHEDVSFDDNVWQAYREVNRKFAKTIAAEVRDGELIWVQDYHLLLLPAMLREELAKREDAPKDVKIGFFLHTPFPSAEIYRILPVREEILRGVLESDLIGFHTIDYVRHFLSSCDRVLRLHTTPGSVQYKGRYVEVQDFPIGIEPDAWADRVKEAGVVQRVKELKKKFEGMKVIVGVDRLDYIKGVQQKLHAFEVFLTDYPEWIGKAMLVQIGVPSRPDVEEYQDLRATVNELVGRINGKFGTLEFQPVLFLFKPIAPTELAALYVLGDACLVTSTRDGMNLVSYEYVACHSETHGTLILSEFAGAAQSLNGSIVVNPWDTDAVAAALSEAVSLSDEVRAENYAKLAHRVWKYTSRWWGDSFVKEIVRIKEDQLAEQEMRLESGSDSQEEKEKHLKLFPELERCPGFERRMMSIEEQEAK